VCFREKNCRKETTIVDMLRFIHGPFWKTFFVKNADELEQSAEEDDEYMIFEHEPSICNMFSNFPRGQP
jgi:hypothetical protein